MDVLGKDTISVLNPWVEAGDWRPPFPPGPDVTKNQITTLSYAQWEDRTDKAVTTSGPPGFIQNYISIFIPHDIKTTDGRKYIEAAKFNALPSTEKPNYWTVDISKDVFLGIVPPITETFTIAEARKQFRNCVIKSIDNNLNNDLIPHLELLGI
jgi:hypothetical protein